MRAAIERPEQLARRWWVPVARGAAAMLFGVVALFWPGITLLALVFLFGIWAVADGVLALLTAAARGARHERWGSFLLEGVLGIGAGVVAFIWPGITAVALLYLIAAWAILTGIAEIAAAIRLRKLITTEWALGIAGVLSIGFGIVLAFLPGVGLLAVTWLIGLYAVLFGAMLVAVGLRVRTLQDDLERRREVAA